MKRLTVFTMIFFAILIYSTAFCGGDDPKTTPTPDPTDTPTPSPTDTPTPTPPPYGGTSTPTPTSTPRDRTPEDLIDYGCIPTPTSVPNEDFSYGHNVGEEDWIALNTDEYPSRAYRGYYNIYYPPTPTSTPTCTPTPESDRVNSFSIDQNEHCRFYANTTNIIYCPLRSSDPNLHMILSRELRDECSIQPKLNFWKDDAYVTFRVKIIKADVYYNDPDLIPTLTPTPTSTITPTPIDPTIITDYTEVKNDHLEQSKEPWVRFAFACQIDKHDWSDFEGWIESDIYISRYQDTTHDPNSSVKIGHYKPAELTPTPTVTPTVTPTETETQREPIAKFLSQFTLDQADIYKDDPEEGYIDEDGWKFYRINILEQLRQSYGHTHPEILNEGELTSIYFILEIYGRVEAEILIDDFYFTKNGPFDSDTENDVYSPGFNTNLASNWYEHVNWEVLSSDFSIVSPGTLSNLVDGSNYPITQFSHVCSKSDPLRIKFNFPQKYPINKFMFKQEKQYQNIMRDFRIEMKNPDDPTKNIAIFEKTNEWLTDREQLGSETGTFFTRTYSFPTVETDYLELVVRKCAYFDFNYDDATPTPVPGQADQYPSFCEMGFYNEDSRIDLKRTVVNYAAVFTNDASSCVPTITVTGFSPAPPPTPTPTPPAPPPLYLFDYMIDGDQNTRSVIATTTQNVPIDIDMHQMISFDTIVIRTKQSGGHEDEQSGKECVNGASFDPDFILRGFSIYTVDPSDSTKIVLIKSVENNSKERIIVPVPPTSAQKIRILLTDYSNANGNPEYPSIYEIGVYKFGKYNND
jgi:hypothetical protein